MHKISYSTTQALQLSWDQALRFVQLSFVDSQLFMDDLHAFIPY